MFVVLALTVKRSDAWPFLFAIFPGILILPVPSRFLAVLWTASQNPYASSGLLLSAPLLQSYYNTLTCIYLLTNCTMLTCTMYAFFTR
nr:MAG TPA: hypothetical protein [Bacteriophage sp.]